mgnify:CR=1 FL=1
MAYGDNIEAEGMAPLAAREAFLVEFLGDSVSALHLLPFYPYTSDDGFSFTDYRQFRQTLGSWSDIERLARNGASCSTL